MDDGRTTFLFWNVGLYKEGEGNPEAIKRLLPALVREQAADVVLLAECCWPEQTTAGVLSSAADPWIPHPAKVIAPKDSRGRGLKILSRWDSQCHNELAGGWSYRAQTLAVPDGIKILLVLAHLQTKQSEGQEEQYDKAREFAQELAAKEDEDRRTLLVGDLNLQPFEAPIVHVRGLNAVMCRSVASSKAPTIRGVRYPRFYNPMWRHLGGAPPRVPASSFTDDDQAEGAETAVGEALATCYSTHGSPPRYYWYMHDQVLLRPALLRQFRDEDLWLVTESEAGSLLDRHGRPSKTVASDHLPLVLRLDLRRPCNE